MSNKLGLILMLTVAISCRKEADVFPDTTVQSYTGVNIIAHKAGGGEYSSYTENTLEAAIYAFTYSDGIETDVQLSRDNTLWLFHDEVIKNCDGVDKRIPGLTDNEIKAIIKCKGLQLNTLKDVFDYQKKSGQIKWVSLDIKSWLPTRYSNTQGYLIRVADAITKLTLAYKCGSKIIVECENAYCLNRVKEKDKDIGCFLTTFGDFDKGAYRALKAGYEGISYKYSKDLDAEQIKTLHRKGLQIQLWTVNDSSDIAEAIGLSPDFIQTDNVRWR